VRGRLQSKGGSAPQCGEGGGEKKRTIHKTPKHPNPKPKKKGKEKKKKALSPTMEGRKKGYSSLPSIKGKRETSSKVHSISGSEVRCF